MPSKEFVSDIKTFFDAIRNIGICAALTFGLPFVDQSTPVVCGGNWLKIAATGCTIGVIIGLYIFNLVWLFSSLVVKPNSKSFNVFSSIVVISLISLAIGNTAFSQVWELLFNYS